MGCGSSKAVKIKSTQNQTKKTSTSQELRSVNEAKANEVHEIGASSSTAQEKKSGLSTNRKGSTTSTRFVKEVRFEKAKTSPQVLFSTYKSRERKTNGKKDGPKDSAESDKIKTPSSRSVKSPEAALKDAEAKSNVSSNSNDSPDSVTVSGAKLDGDKVVTDNSNKLDKYSHKTDHDTQRTGNDSNVSDSNKPHSQDGNNDTGRSVDIHKSNDDKTSEDEISDPEDGPYSVNVSVHAYKTAKSKLQSHSATRSKSERLNEEHEVVDGGTVNSTTISKRDSINGDTTVKPTSDDRYANNETELSVDTQTSSVDSTSEDEMSNTEDGPYSVYISVQKDETSNSKLPSHSTTRSQSENRDGEHEVVEAEDMTNSTVIPNRSSFDGDNTADDKPKSGDIYVDTDKESSVDTESLSSNNTSKQHEMGDTEDRPHSSNVSVHLDQTNNSKSPSHSATRSKSESTNEEHEVVDDVEAVSDGGTKEHGKESNGNSDTSKENNKPKEDPASLRPSAQRTNTKEWSMIRQLTLSRSSTMPIIDEDNEVVEPSEYYFAEFPSHVLLREANEKYAILREGEIPKEGNEVLPFPGSRPKKDIFKADEFVELDTYAEKTPLRMLRGPIEDIVTYLNEKCNTVLEKIRAYFRWLTTRNIQGLIKQDKKRDHEKAVLNNLTVIKTDKTSGGRIFTKLFETMCRIGGVPYHSISGKVRTANTLDRDQTADNTSNDWVAVLVEDEWRFIDVHFAALKGIGEDPGEWELIDDNGQGYRDVKPAPSGVTYESDEFYFLTDPEEFIYDHFPDDENWQLLARPVMIDEFQNMAFLRSPFFENNLTIGDQCELRLDSSDGEVEISIGLPVERCRFMYQFWRSTKEDKFQHFDIYELSQFVLLEQREGYLYCKVVFPASGHYKLNLFVRTESEKGRYYRSACTYLIHCETARADCNALPRNPRNEWGYTHEMRDLGLQWITHQSATIETDDGYLKIKFRCIKDPVNCLLKVRGLQENNDQLQKHILFRQNESKTIIIYIQLPTRGLYALDLYGANVVTKMETTTETGQTLPQISTYLIAANTGTCGLYQYPTISDQRAGQQNANAPLKVVPHSHKESIFTYAEKCELELSFDTLANTEAIATLKFWNFDGTSDDMDQYTFWRKQQKSLSFLLRFPYTGTYTLMISEIPKGSGNVQAPFTFIYVIFVQEANPEWLPFPEPYRNEWGEECELEKLRDGEFAVREQKEIRMIIPNSKIVQIIPENAEVPRISLVQGEDKKWHSEFGIEEEGAARVFVNYGDGNTLTAVLKYQVKKAEPLERERHTRIERQRHIQAVYNERTREEDTQSRMADRQFADIKQAIEKALKERNISELKSAIARVENDNYTERLKMEYEEAKQLKRSLERLASLGKSLVKMDERRMADVINITTPTPFVHVTIRALFLLLGHTLKQTKDWKNCQAMGKGNGLNEMVQGFDIRAVPLENAIQARNILDPIRVEDVRAENEGAAVFYNWVLGMSKEVIRHHEQGN